MSPEAGASDEEVQTGAGDEVAPADENGCEGAPAPELKLGPAPAPTAEDLAAREAAAAGYASYAWLLQGATRSLAGWLDLSAGRLRFSCPGRVVFDVPLEEVTDVVYPWYYFGGGVKLHAAGQPYRISFVRPNGAEYAAAKGAAAVGDAAALLVVASKARAIGDGRGVGKEWRQLLEKGAVEPVEI